METEHLDPVLNNLVSWAIIKCDTLPVWTHSEQSAGSSFRHSTVLFLWGPSAGEDSQSVGEAEMKVKFPLWTHDFEDTKQQMDSVLTWNSPDSTLRV